MKQPPPFLPFWLALLALGGTTWAYSYEEKTLDVQLDQFGFGTNETFKLRYLINDTFWKNHSDSPIFLYTGNEGDITNFANNTGFMFDIAPKFGALIVFAEHRYYGKSQPNGHKPFPNPQYWGYLSSEQALADYVQLVKYLWGTIGAKRPVIAFGGSYGGMLAAWMRMKYPHIVTGAIASSAPILQFLVDCERFYMIMTTVYDEADKTTNCVNNVRNSWKAIRDKFAEKEGLQWFTKNWKLCPANGTPVDADAVKDYLELVYQSMAMANYPYEANFLGPMPAFPVEEFCKRLGGDNLAGDKLLLALSDALSVYSNYTGKTQCIDVTNKQYAALDTSIWDFQTCTEMVMPFCSDGRRDMFEPSTWDLTAYSDNCYKKFGVRPRVTMAVDRYGGADIGAASNIAFSNGLLDPWISGGVLQDISDTVTAILITNGAHHLDLRGANERDPNTVILARKSHEAKITSWISSQRQGHKRKPKGC